MIVFFLGFTKRLRPTRLADDVSPRKLTQEETNKFLLLKVSTVCLLRLRGGTVARLFVCCSVVCGLLLVSANVDRLLLLLLLSITVMLCRSRPVSHLQNQSDKILTGISGRRRVFYFFFYLANKTYVSIDFSQKNYSRPSHESWTFIFFCTFFKITQKRPHILYWEVDGCLGKNCVRFSSVGATLFLH